MKKQFHSSAVLILSLSMMVGLFPASSLAIPSRVSPGVIGAHRANGSSAAKASAAYARRQTLSALPGQTATLLPDGQTLIMGGEGPEGPVSIAALRDPAAETLVAISAELRYPRAWHSATMLPDGTVLILGGRGTDGKPVKSIEIFDPATKRFTSRSTNLTPRSNHTATLLTDGSVLIAGGMDKQGRVLDKLEIWDWENGAGLPTPLKLARARYGHNAILQPDGTVLFRGGIGKGGAAISELESYDTNETRMVTTETASSRAAFELRLEASLPENGSHNVPLNKRLALRFSKPVRVDSVSAGSVVLSGPVGPETTKIVPAESGMLVFITPSNPLLGGSTYTLSLNGLVDQNGSMLPPTSIMFMTAAPALPEFEPANSEDWTPTAESRDWRTARERSPWETLPPLQAEPGVTAVSGQVLTLNGLPLADVTLQIKNIAVRTDRTGRFLLTAIEAGHHELVIDGRTASKRRKSYGIFEAGIEVKPGQTNPLGYTIWMPRIDTAHEVMIPSPTNSEVVVTTPHIPGLEVHIPPNTVILDINHKPVTRLSITAIPVDRPPFPLPANVYVPIYFTVQPGGAYVKNLSGYGAKGVRLIYPNYRHEKPGARANFWHYDPEEKGWYVYGQGTVTADGKQVVPDPDISIREFTGAMINVEGYVPPAKAGTPGGPTGGDPVDLSTGLFVLHSTDLAISDVLPISVSRTYHPGDNVSRQFGIGTVLDIDMYLWSANQYQETDLILPDGGRIHYVRISPGFGYNDAVFEHTETPTIFYKSKITRAGPFFWELKLTNGTKFWFGDSSPLGAVVDQHGNMLQMARNAAGDISRLISENGRYIDLSYDGNNRIAQATDNIGRTVTYTYDAGGRLWKVTDPDNGVTEYSYDASNRMLTIKDARGIVYSTNEYDANGRVIGQTQADQTTFQFDYSVDGNNKVIQTDVTDPRGHVRRLTFNSSGYPLTETFALGTPEQQVFTYTRQTGTNLVQSVTDPLGRRTEFTYDSLGNVTNLVELAGTAEAMTSSFTYDPASNGLLTATDPLNHTVTFGYDINHGTLTSVTDPMNHQSTAAYNTAGQPVSATDALNHTSEFAYLSGELSRMTNSLGQSTTRFADGVGRTISMVNPLGQRARYEYDVLNRLTRVTDPLQGLIQFSYDANGNLLSMTDARNNAISYVYDDMDRLITRRDPLLHETSYEYDSNGNVQRVTDRKGKITTFNYDALDRVTLMSHDDGSTTSYTYDAGNRLTALLDSVSGSITYVYDDLDRLTSESTPLGMVSYTYDAAGRRTSMTVPGQQIVNYIYDNADRLTQITQGSATVLFTFDSASRLTSETLPNGVVTQYSYDAASRVTGINYSNGSTTLGDLSYVYDSAGRKSGVGGTFSRTRLPQAVTTTSYNAANQQTAFGGQVLTYDLNGNLTGDGINAYTWNARNQLVSMTGPGLSASFQYDALGRRISKTINGATASYLYDKANIVQEQVAGSASANLLTRGIDQVLSRSESSGTVSVLTEALGSVIALTGSDGAIQTEYSYEPFGNTTTSGELAGNPQKYTSREDDGTALYGYRNRYYSPVLQRFISEDPIGFAGGLNLYAYAENDPVNSLDPFGLASKRGGSWSDIWFNLTDIRSAKEWWNRFHNEQIRKGNWLAATGGDVLNKLLDYSGLSTVQESSEVLGSDASAGAKVWAGTKIVGIGVSWYLAGTTQITGKIAGQTRTSRIIGLRNTFGQHWYTDAHGFFFALDTKFHRLHIGSWSGWFK